MSDDDSDDGRDPALESARRVYDRQISKLESIDDKAMRTARTSVLILGFIAAGLTSAGSDALSGLSLLAVVIGGVGALGVFASAFVSVGIYTVTEYPVEVREGDLRAAGRTTRDRWINGAIGQLDKASTEIEPEIEVNSEYLEYAQLLLLLGVLLLSYGTATAVISQSYGPSPAQQTVLLVALVLAGVGIRVIS
ncbi:hypothetical protein [Haloarcula amylolytica]|uniref:hypothetical protein n=1 Tax=Haloarcula amylolytica TaxID=396317 RepID=UPI003C72BC5F